MVTRRNRTIIHTCVLIIIVFLLLIHGIWYALRRRSLEKFLNETDLSRYANVTWPQRRIPRVIHQTYRTYDIPAVWNTSVQSVIEKNAGEFEYRQWSHTDMDAFVQQHEPEFYRNTFVTYENDIQRVDSFRYVLLYYLGGIYIDMDNGCNRSFRELVTTMEAIDPDASHLVLFLSNDAFGLQTDFMIATPNHPFYKQCISRLHLFNHYFLIHHLTILLSAGPLYATVQERLFYQTKKQVVRLLDQRITRSMFWKTNGGSWFHRDTLIILHLYYNSGRILYYCTISAICLVVCFMLIMFCRQKRRHFSIRLFITRLNSYASLNNSRQQLIRLIKRRVGLTR